MSLATFDMQFGVGPIMLTGEAMMFWMLAASWPSVRGRDT